MSQGTSFTGRSRRRRTKWTVKVADRVAHLLITIGGVGTIVAVSIVCVLLVAEVYPLFLPSSATLETQLPAPNRGARPIETGMDEYQLLGWALYPDGKLHVFRLDTGEQIQQHELAKDGLKLTAISHPVTGSNYALGYSDGSVSFGQIGFGVRFVPETDVPQAARKLALGELITDQGGLLTRTPEGQIRRHEFQLELADPVKLDKNSDSPVVLLDYIERAIGPLFTALTADGKLRVNSVRETKNLMSGKITRRFSGSQLPYSPGRDAPKFLLLTGLGDNVLLAWEDGRLLRFDTRNLRDRTFLAESVDLLPDDSARLTALHFMLGRNTLIAGDSSGGLTGWFRIKPDDAETEDGSLLVPAHRLQTGTSAVTALASSSRRRTFVVGFKDGAVRVMHMTTERTLVETEVPSPVAAGSTKLEQQPQSNEVLAVAMASKEDGFLALTSAGIWRWNLVAEHPEITLAALCLPIWYEEHVQPVHAWQSSSGTDDFEPKFGFYPLVFGTLKATFYSMLFGVPIALLAAIYTSEFLNPRVKAWIKPTIEMMASLPSVVLGFLAGLVFAPYVETIVPMTLTTFVSVPATVLLGAYVWQLLPHDAAKRLLPYRLLFVSLTIPAGLYVAWLAAPTVERLLFGGNFMAWLDGRVGNAVGAWMFLFLPLSALCMVAVVSMFVHPTQRRLTSNWSQSSCALLDWAKYAVGLILTVALALACSLLLNSLGFDPRGSPFSYVSTFKQHNTLVVGFVMGFAIIPIIYTLADDALSTVPEHLRSASLGAGATPWQTAVRIIIPTAMSGLFSAVMIGLGRAVGETMIVLMATGNTPITEMNLFNGFRTLSANVAVELPEASRDSTHYRTLFLAALTLFAMTFVINTAAESVRLRFRRRAYEL